MKFLKQLLFLLFISFASFNGNSQNLAGSAKQAPDPVKWEATYHAASAGTGEIKIKALLDPEWHIYSQKPSADGPIPTSFVYELPAGTSLADTTMEGKADALYSEAFKTKVYSFTKEAIVSQKINFTNKPYGELVIKVEYMACNDKMCLPPKTITLKVNIK
jgi:hypothetical protein